jgi:aconitate hydratase
VVGVIVKDFARIHLANLINWGIVPMTFADPGHYDALDQGDALEIADIRRLVGSGAESLTVKNVTRGTTFEVRLTLTRREREYLLEGGKLAHTKARPIH